MCTKRLKVSCFHNHFSFRMYTRVCAHETLHTSPAIGIMSDEDNTRLPGATTVAMRSSHVTPSAYRLSPIRRKRRGERDDEFSSRCLEQVGNCSWINISLSQRLQYRMGGRELQCSSVRASRRLLSVRVDFGPTGVDRLPLTIMHRSSRLLRNGWTHLVSTKHWHVRTSQPFSATHAALWPRTGLRNRRFIHQTNKIGQVNKKKFNKRLFRFTDLILFLIPPPPSSGSRKMLISFYSKNEEGGENGFDRS